MGISFGSIGTGLPKDIVQQIIKAEKIPIQKMEQRKAQYTNKQKLLNELIGYVSELRNNLLSNRTPRDFRELTTSRYNKDIVDVKVDKNKATPGSYQFEVVQLAQKSSAFSNGVEDPKETYLGVGYLGYELPNGEEKEIYIDAEHSSLAGIAKLINADRTNGMTANVVNDGKDSDAPWRLIIALEDTGDKNNATFPYFYLVDGEIDLYVDEERKGHDAKVKLDGFEIELPSNQANDLINGLSIDLQKADPGNEFTIQVVEDTAKITEKISAIVETVNKALTFIKQQNNLDENSDTRSTLGGDLTLQTLETRIRSTVFKYIETSSGPKRLGDVGIVFDRTGLLKFDTQKFESELKQDYYAIAELFVGTLTPQGQTKGSLYHLSDVADAALKPPAGFLSSRKRGIQSNIRDIDNRISRKERHIAKKEKSLKEKFARLEETVAQIKSQGQGLAGLSAGGAVNPVQQLG